MPHNAASRQSHASRDIVLCNGVMVSRQSATALHSKGSFTNYVMLTININRQLCTICYRLPFSEPFYIVYNTYLEFSQVLKCTFLKNELEQFSDTDFSRSVNPISTKKGRLCPPHYYWHPQIFRPSYDPDQVENSMRLGTVYLPQ